MSTATAVEKLRDIRTEMKAEVVERGIEIDLLIASVIARVHMILLGPPGVAKSLMVDQFLSHIDGATLFSHLLNKNTPPEALFGPVSMMGLKEDKFRRVTTGALPEANLAFVDEIFKSNATNLNGMLKIINERKFENDGGMVDVPLWSMIGASNELPTHDREDLVAFSDRLAVRRVVAPVRTEDGITQVLMGQLARNMGEGLAEGHTSITREELESLQGAATQVKVPGRVQGLIVQLYQKAEQENLHLSMRRVGEGMKLCQANALLAGSGEVKAEDLRLFEHILWNDPDEIEVAQSLTLDFAGTVGKQVARARTAYEEQRKRLSDAQAKMPNDPNVEPEKDVVNDLTTVSAQLRALDERISKEIDQASEEGHDPSELESLQAEVRRSRQSVRETMGMEF